MVEFIFETLEFSDSKEKDSVELRFLKLYTAEIPKKDLSSLGEFRIQKNGITFKDEGNEARLGSRFNMILAHAFDNLTNTLTGKPTAYINKLSGIPLIGSLYFGIVDKGTSMLEVKPLTGCNLNCVFCSVDEGPDSRKTKDIVVEEAYLTQELEKLMAYKVEHDPSTQIDAYINPHGEPTLYAELIPLVRDMRKIKGIKGIILITNGLLLDKKKVNDLKEAGLTSINFSVHATEQKKAAEMFGVKSLPIGKMLDTIAYANSVMDIFVAPVFMNGVNNKDVGDVIRFCKEKGIKNVGIQNFLFNKQGRNPVKSLEWERFEGLLHQWEKEFGVKLLIESKEEVRHTPEYPLPFRKEEVIKAMVMGAGRYADDFIAVARERCIMVSSAKKTHKRGDTISLKITRTLHNVFFGVEV